MPGLAELLTLAGVELAFDHSRRWLKGFLLFEVSENTIRQETQALGQAQDDARNATASAESGPRLGCKRICARPRRFRPGLYGSLDAAKVRIEPRKLAEKQAETETWRDLKVGCWYEAEPVPPTPTLGATTGRDGTRTTGSARQKHPLLLRYSGGQGVWPIDVGDRLRNASRLNARTGLCV